MEVLVFTYLFITKAIQGHMSQSVPNWALIRGQKEKDSAVKYTGQDRTGGESIYRSHRLSFLVHLRLQLCQWRQPCASEPRLTVQLQVRKTTLCLTCCSFCTNLPKIRASPNCRSIWRQRLCIWQSTINTNIQWGDKSLIFLTFRCPITLIL